MQPASPGVPAVVSPAPFSAFFRRHVPAAHSLLALLKKWQWGNWIVLSERVLPVKILFQKPSLKGMFFRK
jgi:hypothetical protein